MNALEVKNLTIHFPTNPYPSVEDVSFVIKENSIAAMIGPNGSGKTTLMRAVLGLIPYQGEILVFGKPVKEFYKEIGFVPQRASFDPTFPITVKEFVSLALSNSQLDKAEQTSHVHEALKSVGSYELVDNKLSTLSGGQLQRVLLARALVNKPRLLILDEPESGVDVGGEQTFYDLIERLVKDKKITALVASHELDIVYTYADIVICLNKRMLCSGVPREILDQDTFIKLYGRGLKFYGHDHKHNR